MKVVFISRPGYRGVELKSGIRFVNCLDHQFKFQIPNALREDVSIHRTNLKYCGKSQYVLIIVL